MWNEQQTDNFQGMTAEIVTLKGYQGDEIHAYVAKPAGSGPYPAMVLAHHMPGWDEFYRETARRFADHGYIAICPNLFERFGHGVPPDVAASARGDGGVADDSVLADCQAALEYVNALPASNGKVGIIGHCSGGRHAYIVACRAQGFSAIVDCWGGNVIMAPERISEKQPVAPIDYTKDLSCPILGIFGNDDQNPPPDQVNQHEEELKKHGKDYEFHRYDGAGHGFWYYDRPAYKQEQAMDAWNKTFEFLGKHLS
jgi:carboxymethylenebutenolidase